MPTHGLSLLFWILCFRLLFFKFRVHFAPSQFLPSLPETLRSVRAEGDTGPAARRARGSRRGGGTTEPADGEALPLDVLLRPYFP